ncbi:hypothetical protein EV421DRAFT_1945488 [Armillaria borealis]|uniref:Uncharacterized protein n=1 Tax=Armillaria borealis TaxID=47425 RepID=A0AA39JL12_9AGAR|nr:hypothetical protein EV421DRAFT_1945488 [Armillaria borealis]
MSSSSYTPSSDGESHTLPSQSFGHSAPECYRKRAERRQAHLNSISSRTIQKFYKHGGALDSQTTESQWETGVYGAQTRTPVRTRSLLRQVQNIELPSLNESESGKESDETGITARHKEVFQVPVHALLEGDITLVEPANDGDLGKVATWLKGTATDEDVDDIPIASSPLQMPTLNMSNFEDYNAAVGYTGGAQLPLGASDGPDIPILVCDPSPAHQDEWTRQDLQPGEIQILMAVHAFKDTGEN